MDGRALLESSAFGPEALKTLFKAFDEAWEAVADKHVHKPLEMEAARARLAGIILSIANDDSRDATAIKNAALKVLSAE